jgi:hypothetical protein
VLWLHTAAPNEEKPLFSAEYLAECELNRTGQTPADLQKVLAASARKKAKTAAPAEGTAAGTAGRSLPRAVSAAEGQVGVRFCR